jgi:hypothetical protein
MSELEEAWELALAAAQARARGAGRGDISEYLSLRRKNDLLRRTATDWLIEIFISIAGEANRAGAGVAIEQHDPHRFSRGAATMVGKCIVLRRGVRQLKIESGWPRVPRDGVVRGGGLACANIKHFGRVRRNVELLLADSRDERPQWQVVDDSAGTPATEKMLRDHFSLLLKDD